MKILKYFFAAALVFVIVACSKNKASVEDAEIAEIEEALKDGSTSRSMLMAIDSLALMADDLTPSEAVRVLVTYMHVQQDAAADKNTMLELETMRKFVDVYDIVMSVNGTEMRDTFSRLAARNPSFNIIATAKDYRERLSDYADDQAIDGESGAEEAPKETADTTAVATSDEPEPVSVVEEEPEPDASVFE